MDAYKRLAQAYLTGHNSSLYEAAGQMDRLPFFNEQSKKRKRGIANRTKFLCSQLLPQTAELKSVCRQVRNTDECDGYSLLQ